MGSNLNRNNSNASRSINKFKLDLICFAAGKFNSKNDMSPINNLNCSVHI